MKHTAAQAKPSGVPPPLGVLVNPPGELLGRRNAVLTGTGRRYYVPNFEGCLSIKSVTSGSAVWETPGRRFELHENSYLVLNDRQNYTITIDSALPSTTFCVFFERGFVEDVFRAMASSSADLLEDADTIAAPGLGFIERIESQQSSVLSALLQFKAKLDRGWLSPEESVSHLFCLAEKLITENQQIARASSRLPAARPATRTELFRRVLRGRDFLLSSASSQVSLREAARAACLSPYHFHRSFLSAFGVAPYRYLTRHRLERARYLLLETERSVTEICMGIGFESHGSFSTLFRREFGVSPRECRQSKKLARLKK
jgi:AraC family transcriptional regulator